VRESARGGKENRDGRSSEFGDSGKVGFLSVTIFPLFLGPRGYARISSYLPSACKRAENTAKAPKNTHFRKSVYQRTMCSHGFASADVCFWDQHYAVDQPIFQKLGACAAFLRTRFSNS